MRDININIDNVPIADENVTSVANNLLNTTGVSDIVNTVNNGNIDDVIASTVNSFNTVTSQAGATSVTGQLHDISQQIASMSFSMTDQAIDQCLDAIFELISDFFADTGILDVIQKGVEVANTTVDLAKLGLNIASSGTTIAANTAKMADAMCMLKDMNVTCIPTPKEIITMKAAIAGQMAKEIILAQYNTAKQQLLDLKNSLICTSNDAVIDNVIASVNAILDFIQPLIDPYLAEYTGYTVANVKLLCNTGFQFINMITRSVAMAKTQKTMAEDQISNEISDNSYDENESDKDRKKKENAAKSKAEFDKHKKDLSKEEAKAKLLEWLYGKNILLQNAFYIVMVKDLIDDIAMQCQKLQNSGIENIVDFLNSVDMVFKLFELFGYRPGKSGITFDELAEFASLLGATALQTAQSVSDQIESNSIDAINKNIYNGRAALQNVQLNKDTYEGKVFSSKTTYASGNVNIEMTIYANPEINSKTTDYLKDFKQSDGKRIFNNIKLKTITDNIQDAWDDNIGLEFEISAKVDGITKKYVFSITVDKTEYEKWLSDKSQVQIAIDETASETDKTLSALKNSISQLANVNVTIDMTLLENYFKDKVIMFDCIVKMIDALYPVYKILQTLAHLIENYKINKEFVRTKQRVSIAEAAKTISQTYNMLNDVINLEDTNFFPVRTEGMSRFVHANFGQPTTDGTLTVGVDGTYKLQEYCLINEIIPQPELSFIKGTTFYFDTDNDGTYKDGTLDGLDNVDYNEEMRQVYYDSRHRSTIASQILRAKSRNEDPYLKGGKTPVTDNGYDGFFDSITVQSDEFEGQQAVDLDSLYCCPPVDLYDIADANEYYDVIEFADEYTGGDAMDYSWNVKPGDNINEHTILAYIHKNGKDIPVKSIYSKGKVMENSDHTFMHIYPDSCDRHICIADTSLGNPTDFDYAEVQNIMNDMSDSCIVFNLMMNNMVRSMLPYLLYNADRPITYDESGRLTETVSIVSSKFKDIVDEYDVTIKDFSEKIAGLSSEDNIKGNIKDLSGLGSQIMDVKNVEMYRYIKGKYEDMLNMSYTGNNLYNDCKNLATNSEYKGNIGDGDYNNYYMQLIANIDLNQDNKYVNSFYTLIKGIISNRIGREQINVSELKNQFNDLFDKHICKCDDAYSLVDGKITDPTFKKVKASIREMALIDIMNNRAYRETYKDGNTYKQAFDELQSRQAPAEDYDALYDALENYVHNDKKYEYDKYDGPINQLANIFIAIKTHDINIRSSADIGGSRLDEVKAKTFDIGDTVADYESLIRDEAFKIKKFWDDLIAEYESELDFGKSKSKLAAYMNEIGKYAEWPQGIDMAIGGNTYKVYTFVGKKDISPDMPDITAGDMTDTDIPDAEIDYTKIADINGPGVITIMDYQYWLTYMANATLFTLLPTYWADGFDVPPTMTPTLLPAIYFPILPPVNIPVINVTLVTGLAIRGLWVFPILLVINQNAEPINAVFPAITALQTTKQVFERTLSTLENGIPKIVDQVLNGFAEENAGFKKELDRFRTYASIFRSIPIEDKALIEEEFKAAVYDADEKIETAKEKRKAAREKKKRDKRQVITREENLGEGLDPL